MQADIQGTIALLIIGCFSFGCEEEDEPVWAQFNARNESVEVEVGIEEELDPVTTTLHSSSGLIEVGSASVQPGGGPFGTEHTITVEVDDEWEHEVQRCTVQTLSQGRGQDEYELVPDSADEGLYSIVLVSVGDPGEVRTDLLTFLLWYDKASEDEAATSD